MARLSVWAGGCATAVRQALINKTRIVKYFIVIANKLKLKSCRNAILI
jgi:phage terminase large subunit-like protein